MHSFIDLKPLSAYQYGRSAFPAMKFAQEHEPDTASSNFERGAGNGSSGAVAERDFAARPMRGESGRGGRVQGCREVHCYGCLARRRGGLASGVFVFVALGGGGGGAWGAGILGGEKGGR